MNFFKNSIGFGEGVCYVSLESGNVLTKIGQGRPDSGCFEVHCECGRDHVETGKPAEVSEGGAGFSTKALELGL